MDIKDNPVEIQPLQYREAIQHKNDFFIQFAVFDKNAESHFNKIVRAFLSFHDILYLRDIVFTITKELITNSVKANAKRLYFIEKKLDINNSSDYKTGMMSFKTDVLYDNSRILQKLIETNLRVRVVFTSDNETSWIKIINNIGIVEEELDKIKEKIRIAYENTDLSEAISQSYEEIEGAGLGLIMATMVYKNAGFRAEDFTITSENNKTISAISIYNRVKNNKIKIKLTDEISKEIDTLPSFPDQIRKIEMICSNPDISLQAIANMIKQDVALSTSILKLANSAGYVKVKRAETIEESIKVIGINGLKTLITAVAINHIIESRYKKYKEIWIDSYKRAFYAQMICMQLPVHVSTDNAYLGGLLSEIGKIVLLSIKNNTITKISKIMGEKSSGTVDIIEEMALGISHATLGGLIARKWQFSENLVKTIEFYLRPYMIDDQNRDVAYIVHLAHIFVEIERKKTRYEIIDDEVLDYFHLSNKETFERLHRILMQAYCPTLSI